MIELDNKKYLKIQNKKMPLFTNDFVHHFKDQII